MAVSEREETLTERRQTPIMGRYSRLSDFSLSSANKQNDHRYSKNPFGLTGAAKCIKLSLRFRLRGTMGTVGRGPNQVFLASLPERA